MNKSVFLPFLLGPVAAQTALATVYMSEEQAVKGFFPGLKFTKATETLTPAEIEKLSAVVKDKVRPVFTVYKSAGGESVVIDQVLGKHELITYAVALTADGKVKAIDILEYRESYGFEVRRPAWRAQFEGKTKADKFQLDEDIKNISGATLSSVHITNGVKRVLLAHDLVKSRS